MATQQEIRNQYTQDELDLMDRLGIDPPDLTDLAENIAANCAPWQAPDTTPEGESAEDCDEDESEDEGEEGEYVQGWVDLRLKLRRSGYVLNTGDAQYDQDGRGPCGVGSIRIDDASDPDECAKVARELVGSALEDACDMAPEDIAA